MNVFRNKVSTIWWLLVITSSIIMPLFEGLILMAVRQGSIISYWNIAAISYLWLVIEGEIYFFENIRYTHWWQQRILPKLEIFFKSDDRDSRNTPSRWSKLIIDLEYLGLMLSTTIINLGKIGTLAYVNSRAKLRFGRLRLYAGCLIRVILEYWALRQI